MISHRHRKRDIGAEPPMEVLIHERLPPVAVQRKGPAPKLAYVGALAALGVAASVLAPWGSVAAGFDTRDIRGTDLREGELILACAAIAVACFLFMVMLRSSLVMIPAVLAGALMSGLSIMVVTDRDDLFAQVGVPAGALDPGWVPYAMTAGGIITVFCAFVVGWDYRRRW